LLGFIYEDQILEESAKTKVKKKKKYCILILQSKKFKVLLFIFFCCFSIFIFAKYTMFIWLRIGHETKYLMDVIVYILSIIIVCGGCMKTKIVFYVEFNLSMRF
jgi:hypothetical protein